MAGPFHSGSLRVRLFGAAHGSGRVLQKSSREKCDRPEEGREVRPKNTFKKKTACGVTFYVYRNAFTVYILEEKGKELVDYVEAN